MLNTPKKDSSSSSRGARVIQLHPTLNCNLKCKHCYSSSAPGLRSAISPESVIQFLQYARGYGYDTLSISGGEPFLYRDVAPVLEAAKSLGFHTMIASNGMLLNSKTANRVLDMTDVVAISIDGKEVLHDEIRGQKGAFQKMMHGVRILRERKQTFGFIHTLTPKAWQDLLWISEHAAKNGARLLQLHPLEIYGRASETFDKRTITQLFLHKAYIMGNILKAQYSTVMKVQLDFLHKQTILANPELISYYGNDCTLSANNFAEITQSIIVDEVGNIIPVGYGFSPELHVGNIKELDFGIDPIADYIYSKGDDLLKVIADTYKYIADDENEIVPFAELIIKQSNMFRRLNKSQM